MKKRLLAMVLTVVMLLSAMPTVVFAAETGCNHKWEETVVTGGDYTCEDRIIVKQKCSECGVTKYVARAGHTWDEGKVTTEPTCGAKGVKSFVCTKCGETKTEEIPIPADAKHTWGEEEIIKEATCKENAWVGQKCTVCGKASDKLIEVPDSKTDHKNVIVVPAKEATCGEAGYNEYLMCQDCETVLSEKVEIPATGKHTEVKIEAKPATCTTPGTKDGVECSVCGKVLVTPTRVNVDKNAHVWPKEPSQVVKAATCTENGIGKYVCEECGASKYDPIPAAHTWGATTQVITKATCDTDGEEIRYCSKCQIKETFTIKALGHNWGEYVEKSKADCVKDGEMVRTCDRCDATESKIVPALGHKYIVDTKPADCENNAKQGKFCQVCGDEVDVKELPGTALGHKEKYEEEVPATCTEDGHTAGVVCTVCGKMLNQATVIPATGHKEEIMKAKAPTCNATGLTEGKKCSVCGEILVKQNVIPADKSAHVEKFVALGTTSALCTQTVVGKVICTECGKLLRYAQGVTGHQYPAEPNEVVTPADCEQDGKEIYICTVCGVKDTRVIKAEGHKEDKGVVTLKPTCAEAGEKTFTCKNCGKTRTEEIPATGKHEAVEGEIPATCTSDKKVGLVCKVCGAAMGEMKDVPGTKLEHNYQPVAEKPATCKEPGHKAGIQCTLCDDVKSGMETIAATGKHTEVVIPGYKADCQNTGLSDGKKCSVCGDITVKQEVLPIDPTNHHGGDAVKVLKPATCTSTGISLIKCSYCGYSNYEIVKKTDHAFGGIEVTVDPTCVAEGHGTLKCSVCGYTEVVTIEPTGVHTWSEVDKYGNKTCTVCGKVEKVTECKHANAVEIPGKPATCKETGLTAGMKCADCGEILLKQEEIPLAEHTEEEIPGKDATCKEPGLTVGLKCSVCEEILLPQEEIPATGKHTEEVIPGKSATCQVTGLTDGVRCSVCGDILMPQEETPLAAHTEEIIPGKPATSTESGLTDGVKCSVCGTVLMAQQTIPATGCTSHNFRYSGSYLDENGKAHIVYKCTVCGAEK